MKLNLRNVVETELVVVLGGGNDTDPVTEAVLLEELFGEVLQIPLGERNVRGDGDFSVAWIIH